MLRPELKIDKERLERERMRTNDIEHEKYISDYVWITGKNFDEAKKGNSFLKHPAASPRTQHKKVFAVVKKTSDFFTNMKNMEKEMKLQLYCRGCAAGVDFKIREDGEMLVGEAIPVERGFYLG